MAVAGAEVEMAWIPFEVEVAPGVAVGGDEVGSPPAVVSA